MQPKRRKSSKTLIPKSQTLNCQPMQQQQLVPFEDPLQHHKLCGFFSVILSVTSPTSPDAAKTIQFGTRCYLSGDGSDELGFRTEDGIVLSLIQPGMTSSEESLITTEDLITPEVKKNGKRKRKVSDGECSGATLTKKKRRFGYVNGSKSVVHQLDVLVASKCLEIVARVVGVSVRSENENENASARAVVLVDVYLPIEVWSGWQFGKFGVTAAALFAHLSCNWEQRNVMLIANGGCCEFTHEDSASIWTHSDCHVLGCKIHCNTSGSSKRKLFELHEIFRSLPCVTSGERICCTSIKPADAYGSSGIWEVSDDVLVKILTALGPTDLVKISATCRHLKSLAVPIMPCMKLKLYPHQQAAVEWMLRRERNAEVLAHPLYMDFSTEDGFQFYLHAISGEIVTGIAPTVTDFRGGMFCDEPGLGKTITALSLILKTQGTWADPPDGAEVVWCMDNHEQRCGYYELSAENLTTGKSMPSWKRLMGQNGRQGHVHLGSSKSSSKGLRLMGSDQFLTNSADPCSSKLEIMPGTAACSLPAPRVLRCTRSLGSVKRNLFGTHGGSRLGKKRKVKKNVFDKRNRDVSSKKMCNGKSGAKRLDCNETWAQCDACRKWRKLSSINLPDATTAWFCSMNSDPLYQKCAAPEESWDYRQSITYLPGFCTKGTRGGEEENVSFFTSVLKEHNSSMNFETKRALTWLAKLSDKKLLEMEKTGLTRPVLDTRSVSNGDSRGYHKIFQAFGLTRKVERGTSRWYYPSTLENLSFDVAALQIALTKPLDLFRLYLSRATLIVVPANLIDHWRTQISKHVRPGQLRVYVWADHKKPSAHNLAWDYDIVITTFTRLSAEWGPRKKSALTQVHWLRVMLDEGHTLGSSLSLTNKLQMAISLTASNRWLLTGTPTPNTPNSQVSHLQPMLKFLHEEAYGHNQKSWESGVLRPFEAEMEEGRSRLLELLRRCMISARKIDLQTIPPCIKKVVFLHFTEEHARTYNELVVTVRRNILMADWNDPSHVESLLNPKQWKFRSTLIKNVRLSCCVAGHIKVTDAGQDIQETMDILVEQGLDPFSADYILIKISLLEGGNCFRCKEWCRLPVITPCRHLLCLDCVAQDSEKCTLPGCGNLYEMQSPEILTRPENPNPKWPVPKDLIELQPSYKQDDWDPDWQSTSSSKVAYLLERLKALQEANKQLGYSLDGDDEDCKPCEVLATPSKKTKWDMFHHQGACPKLNSEPYKIPPEKVIVFSQFLEHIHVIEQQLRGAGIEFARMYSPMNSSIKMKSLKKFQHDENCMVLLMDGSGALGLDLSFVTHVFLMEPIWDRSMEEQVISRAHRMGATRPINVETLAMHGTIEEQMLEFLQDTDGSGRTLKEELGKPDREAARAHRTLHDFAESNYLAHLSFVRTNSVT